METDRGNIALHEILLKLQPPLSYRISSLLPPVCPKSENHFWVSRYSLEHSGWDLSITEDRLCNQLNCTFHRRPKNQSGHRIFFKMSKNVLGIPQCVQKGFSCCNLHMRLHIRESREQIHVLRTLKGSKAFEELSKEKGNTSEVTATNTQSQVLQTPVFFS